MSHSLDHDNNSDDLIAELARLMAEDAQGAPSSKEAVRHEVRREPTVVEPVAPVRQAPQAEVRETNRDQMAPAAPRVEQTPRAESRSVWGTEPAKPSAHVTPESRPQPVRAAFDAISPTRKSPVDDRLDREDGMFAQSPKSDSFQDDKSEVDVTDSSIDDVFAALSDQIGGHENQRQKWDQSKAAAPRADAPQVDEDPIAALIAAQASSAAANVRPLGQANKQQDAFEAPPIAESYRAPAPKRPEPVVTAPIFPARETRHASNRDPLDEIESLIGDAVRQGTAQGLDRVPETLTNEGVEDAASAAEAAILAASNSAKRAPSREPGHQVQTPKPQSSAQDWRTPLSTAGEADMQGYRPAERVKTTPWHRKLVAPSLVVLALFAVGGGAYYMFGRGSSTDTVAPVLTSNTEGAKVDVAADPKGAESITSIVVNELDGVAVDPNNEKLVSRDQTESGVRKIETVDNGSGLANRKVRTVTVRPDGTIVASDNVVAGSEVLPVERPNVPQLPGTESPATSDFQVSSATPETPQVATPDTAVTQEVISTRANPPIPMPRPVNREALRAAAVQPTVTPVTTNNNSAAIDLFSNNNSAVSAPVAAPISAPAATAVAGNAAAYVQMSSQRSTEAAESTLVTLRNRFSNVIDTSKLIIKPVDLADKGVFYRVLVPASSLGEANKLCTDVKTAGGDCFVRTN